MPHQYTHEDKEEEEKSVKRYKLWWNVRLCSRTAFTMQSHFS